VVGFWTGGSGLVAQITNSQPASLPELKWHLTARPWQPLNTSRTNLLDKVENIVNALAPLQYWNTASPGDVQDGGDVQNGSIIDPYRLSEWQYATPYFSFAVATAVASGRSTNLLEFGARALDHSTADIAGLDGNYQANASHGEFFGAPMMKALRLYKQIAPLYPSVLTSNRIARWESRLTTSRTLYMNNGVTQNWRTYGMKGEWLRVQDGLIPRNAGTSSSSYQGVSYIEDRWLNEQRARYVRDRDVLGLNPYFLSYHDDDAGTKQNFAYWGGATGNLLDMIRNGYDGASRADIEQTVRFSARSLLLMTAGSGDAPAGGRTGDHVWNDIVYGNTFELAAEMAWADGNARLAGQYRRAARLAFQSAWRFQQEHGWFSVTKSLISPAHQNHYADWSALCNYNGYTEIHSSEAFATELSPIPEQPAPAEIGGYVAILDEQFDNTFANAGGMQVQICTEGSTAANLAGSLRWYALGIARFSRPGWESRLGPGDGWMKADGSQAISFAPTFFESNAWQMVSQQPDRFIGAFTPTFTHPLLVRGTLTITPKSGQTGPSFAMNLTLTPDGVLVDTSRTAGTNSFGLTWPLMEYDGKHVLSTNITSHIASTAYPKMSATKTITEAENATLSGGVTLATAETNFSGTGYAVFPASGGAIEWTGVNGGDGGPATVGFRYSLRQATATNRTVTLTVNGQPQSVRFEHTGNPSTYGGSVLSFPMVWHQLHVPVTLNAGTANTVRLEAGTAGGLNIDEMRVFPADAAQPEPDQQNFISLDASPTIDATTPVRRTAYGDQRPVRVTTGTNSVTTFVYPRTAGDPTAEAVRASFVRNGANFSSVLGRVTNNLYIGRTSAGGEGSAMDLDGDGTNDVSFSETCAFVLQLTNGTVAAIEADRFVTVTNNNRQVKLAPYTPIVWSDTGMLWNNVPLATAGKRFEITVDFTATNGALLGFAGDGVTHPFPSQEGTEGWVSNLIAGVQFGTNGLIAPGNVPYQAGVVYGVRAFFDLVAGTYSLWVSDQPLVANAALPAGVTNAAALDIFAFFADAAAASEPVVTNYPDLSVTIVSPSGPIVFLGGTNTTLQLVGAVTNAFGPVTTAWAKTNGPGTVTFGDSNALATTARFSAEGAYRLTFSANGDEASTGLTVVVGFGSTNGLNAWWKMDETNATTAADSSGNARTATLTAAAFTNGYIANAYRGTGTTSRATYSANDSNQVTVAAWVRCDTTGGGSFPRIVDAPSYRVLFRFSSSDVNSLGFATTDTTNGDWDSGAGSISLGNWFHVAVSYDRSNLANLPAFYINGAKRTTVTLAMPSGTPPSLSGTGYIGNNSANSRSWIGLLDDVRIYSRLLSDSEIQVLAALPPANIAPSVNAGTNQTGVVGVPITLAGTASDDGPFTTTWSQLSGPGTTSFGDANATNTTATFNAAGSYTLRLSADDGQAQSVSDVGVTVISVQQSWANHYGVAADATDADGDGLSNADEFLAGFDPTNTVAFARIVGIAVTNETDIALTYLAADGDTSYAGGPVARTNVLEAVTGEFTNSFTTTGLTNVLSGGIGLGTNVTVTDPFGATNTPARYYRVRVLVP
jgi:hypothetical protein